MSGQRRTIDSLGRFAAVCNRLGVRHVITTDVQEGKWRLEIGERLVRPVGRGELEKITTALAGVAEFQEAVRRAAGEEAHDAGQ